MGEPGKETLVVYCDGGARGNPGPGAAGCLIEDSAGKVRYFCGKYLGETTNNQAEYQAVKLALEVIKENYKSAKDINVYLDSLLAAQQLNGIFKVKNPKLKELFMEVRALEIGLGKIYYFHINREGNFEADRLANKSMDEKSIFVTKEPMIEKT